MEQHDWKLSLLFRSWLEVESENVCQTNATLLSAIYRQQLVWNVQDGQFCVLWMSRWQFWTRSCNWWEASGVNSCDVSPKVGCLPWRKSPLLAQSGRKLTFSKSMVSDWRKTTEFIQNIEIFLKSCFLGLQCLKIATSNSTRTMTPHIHQWHFPHPSTTPHIRQWHFAHPLMTLHTSVTDTTHPTRRHFTHLSPTPHTRRHFTHLSPTPHTRRHFTHLSPTPHTRRHFTHLSPTPHTRRHFTHLSPTPHTRRHFTHLPPTPHTRRHFTHLSPTPHTQRHFTHLSPTPHTQRHFTHLSPTPHTQRHFTHLSPTPHTRRHFTHLSPIPHTRWHFTYPSHNFFYLSLSAYSTHSPIHWHYYYLDSADEKFTHELISNIDAPPDDMVTDRGQLWYATVLQNVTKVAINLKIIAGDLDKIILNKNDKSKKKSDFYSSSKPQNGNFKK